jgi:hypothetical protein
MAPYFRGFSNQTSFLAHLSARLIPDSTLTMSENKAHHSDDADDATVTDHDASGYDAGSGSDTLVDDDDDGITEEKKKTQNKAPMMITMINCPVCDKPVRTRRLARHQRTQKCQLAGVRKLPLEDDDDDVDEAKTRAQKKKRELLLVPRRTFLDVPMVSGQGAMKLLLDFLLNTANTASATAHDAVSCLRKIAGVKHASAATLTAPELYALLVDTDALQAFFKVLDTAGMKACSRKRYVDAIRLGLTWLETRPPKDPGTLASAACFARYAHF